MKSYLKKCFIFLAITLLTLSCFCCTSVEASGLQSRAYYSNNFQFSGTSNPLMRNYDGNYMAIEATATSASGTAYNVELSVFLYNRQVTKTYTLSSNGVTKKFDYIYLGSAASSDVSIVCICNSSESINISLVTYSW